MQRANLIPTGYKLQRRVAGYHDIRMDGMTDLVCRAPGASVFDIGCNRGLVGFEFANNGARLVHGCDTFEQGIMTARELFADLRSVEAKFEVVDLTGGPAAVAAAFGDAHYDIVVCLATMHKLKRVMTNDALVDLMQDFGRRTNKYFAWRATSEKPDENEDEMAFLDACLPKVGLKRIHTSYISETLGLAAIWKRNG
jgi:SAM-dependent methyltransferase